MVRTVNKKSATKKVKNIPAFPPSSRRWLFDTIRKLFIAGLLFLILVAVDMVGYATRAPVYISEKISTDIYQSITDEEFINTRSIDTKEQIVFNGSRNERRVALTFDADMTHEMIEDLSSGLVESYYDQELIQVLKSTGTKATLFLSGLWIKNYPDTARDLAGNSLFELANHTYSHPGFSAECYGLTPVQEFQKVDEITRTQELLKILTGTENSLFRFPGGCYSNDDLQKVTRSGQISIQWDVVGEDGFNYDVEEIINNVLENVQNGSIIVLHMNGYPYDPATATALPHIISNLKIRGFELVTVSELLEKEEVRFTKFLDNHYIHSPTKLAIR